MVLGHCFYCKAEAEAASAGIRMPYHQIKIDELGGLNQENNAQIIKSLDEIKGLLKQILDALAPTSLE